MAEAIERVRVYEADPDGRPVEHVRVDKLARLARRGLLSPEMLDAAGIFAGTFYRAQLSSLALSSLMAGRGSAPAPGGVALTESVVEARRQIHDAVAAVGGLHRPTGSCLWAVIGEDRSLNEWRLQCRSAGREIDWRTAVGVLVGALSVLAGHYRL
jgi:hypothetical protein